MTGQQDTSAQALSNMGLSRLRTPDSTVPTMDCEESDLEVDSSVDGMFVT